MEVYFQTRSCLCCSSLVQGLSWYLLSSSHDSITNYNNCNIFLLANLDASSRWIISSISIWQFHYPLSYCCFINRHVWLKLAFLLFYFFSGCWFAFFQKENQQPIPPSRSYEIWFPIHHTTFTINLHTHITCLSNWPSSSQLHVKITQWGCAFVTKNYIFTDDYVSYII